MIKAMILKSKSCKGKLLSELHRVSKLLRACKLLGKLLGKVLSNLLGKLLS